VGRILALYQDNRFADFNYNINRWQGISRLSTGCTAFRAKVHHSSSP
jgi:hypothetical protein